MTFGKYSDSFANRLTWWVMLVVLVLMVVTMFFTGALTVMTLKKEAEGQYRYVLDTSRSIIRHVTSDVHVASLNNISILEKYLDQPDSLYSVMKRFLILNERISGCAVCFEENYFPEKGRWFEPCVSRSKNLQAAQIGGPSHNYLEHDWFSVPMATGKSYWSDPYIDADVSRDIVVSYSRPLRNAKGRIVAVFCVDIPLDWLSSQMKNVDSTLNSRNSFHKYFFGKKKAYSFIISRNGTFIAHPDFKRMFMENINNYVKVTRDTLDDHAVHQMLRGKKSRNETSQIINFEGDPCYLFYTSIKFTGWSMAVVVPKSTLLLPAYITSFFSLFLLVVGLGIVYVVCHLAIRLVTSPLTKFAQAADEVAKGKFDASLPVISSHDEIAHLHDSFEEMQRSLVRYMSELESTTASKAAIDKELSIASDIQLAMLPNVFPPYPERSDFDIYGHLTSAKAIGGDLFDFYLDHDRLVFCIGDVSGKGVPASLVMATTRNLFRTISHIVEKPNEIIARMNDSICDGNSLSMFVTLFVGVLDLPTGHLYYCNAGHEAPILLGDEISVLPVDSNFTVGLIPGMEFSLQETVLSPHITLFLYTDGLSEAENANRDIFGKHQILDVARQLPAAPDPRHLIEMMVKAVKDFVGGAEQSDDLTLLSIRYNGIQIK